MRKSVREATVFGLLGMLVAIIGAVVATESRAGCEARTYAATMVHASHPHMRVRLALPAQKGGITKLQPQEDGITKLQPIPGKQLVRVPVGGRDLWVWVCVESEKSRGVSTEMDEELGDCRHIQNPVRTLDVMMPVPGLSAEDQTAIEKDYWSAYRQAKRAILMDPKSWPPIIGLYGFLAGLGIWIFYRLARFRR